MNLECLEENQLTALAAFCTGFEKRACVRKLVLFHSRYFDCVNVFMKSDVPTLSICFSKLKVYLCNDDPGNKAAVC
jgi:hypothetical protein